MSEQCKVCRMHSPATAADTGLSPIERAQATAGLRNQLTQASGQRSVQVVGDQQAIASQQILPAMHTTLDQMVSAFKDRRRKIVQVLGRTVEGLNENIVRALTGQHTNFGQTFLQAGQGLLKTGLQRAEGAVLGGLGFGKADGSTEASALWVRMASGTGSAGSALGGLLGKIPFIGGFLQGHFAAAAM